MSYFHTIWGEVKYMSNLFKSELKEGEEFPVINRILNALFSSVALCFICWPIVIVIGVISIFICDGMPGGLQTWVTCVIYLCAVAFMILFIYTYVNEKHKPYSHPGHGVYTAGSAPNFHKYQSPEWYQHESLMNQERQAQRDIDRNRN
jgi:hypothetical protein